MSLVSFLIPNFNSGIIVALILAGFGGFLIWLSSFAGLPKLKKRVRGAGVISILAGVGFWIVQSTAQDILQSPKVMAVIGVLVFLAVVGGILFFPGGKKK